MRTFACIVLSVALCGCVGNATNTPKTAYRTGDTCVTFEHKANGMTVVENHCAFRVFVEWFDKDVCATGCGTGPIAPGRSERISHTKGGIKWAACESPGSIKPADGSATWNGGDFRCEG